MDPSTRRSLVNTINKIARYREIASCLYRILKKNTCIRNLRVTAVDLPREAFTRPPEPLATQELGSFVRRLYERTSKGEAKRCQALIGTANTDIKEQFTSQVERTLRESKIHAEIQIVYYLELHPTQLPPRVIASSKDACFLCNAFIFMHSRMHTARTHGRLYPGWRLPYLPGFAELEHRFNQLLASKITASMGTLLSRGQRTVYPDPNESTLLTLPHSETTICAFGDTQDVAGKHKTRREVGTMIKPPQTTHLTGEKFEVISSLSEESSNEKRSRNELDEQTDADRKVLALETVIAEDDIGSQIACATYNTQLLPIVGELDLIKGRDPTHLKGNSVLQTKSLRLYIEGPTQLISSEDLGVGKELTYCFEWLNDSGAYETDRKRPLVDAEELHDEKTYSLDDGGCIFIAARGDIVRLQIMSK